MTNFFDRQAEARRRTFWLIGMFLGAVALIVVVVYLAVSLIVLANAKNASLLSPPRIAAVGSLVIAAIALGSLYKLAALREGGDAVARMLGGRLINPETAKADERRLLNVVEEVALAAGTPVPPVYVLDEEPGINAFAAGFTPGDAVVAVSRGALDLLSRDELQGVIGHEFSHILHGDMRLNLRMIGLLHGILVLSIIGQIVVRIVFGARGDRDSAALIFACLVIGIILMVMGSLGVLLGRIIKCAISRQREFLADATSVQFTRNPDGIAGALKKIGGLTDGSRIRSPNAEQACHMFFGQGVKSLSSLLATHPPLEVRIKELDPSFDGHFPRFVSSQTEPGGVWVCGHEDPEKAQFVSMFQQGPRPGKEPSAVSINPAAAVESVGEPTRAHLNYARGMVRDLPAPLVAATRDPFSARVVIFALLMDDGEEIRRAQLSAVQAGSVPGTAEEVVRLWPGTVDLEVDERIALADMTFPALRRLSDTQYRSFRAMVETLVRADERVSLFEYTLRHMLLRHLDNVFSRVTPLAIRYSSLETVFDDATRLISTLAWLGHEDEAGVNLAFRTGMAELQQGRPGERSVALAKADVCTLAAVDRTLDRLARATPGVKRRVITACAAAIAADGTVTPYEVGLLRAIADSLDCPMPPLLAPALVPARRASAVTA